MVISENFVTLFFSVCKNMIAPVDQQIKLVLPKGDLRPK